MVTSGVANADEAQIAPRATTGRGVRPFRNQIAARLA